MESKFEALSNLFKDVDVARKLMSLSAEDAASYLKEQYNLEFTIDELNDVAAGANKALEEADSDELTEDQLEDVAGGGKGSTAYKVGYYVGKGLQVAGTVAGIAGGVALAVAVFGW